LISIDFETYGDDWGSPLGETMGNLEQGAKTWITVSKQTNNWLVVSTYPCEK